MVLTHISAFSGIGGFEIAMHNAGIPTIASCEIDKHAQGVLADRFPHTTLFNDIKDITGDKLRALGADPRNTIWSSGFPCQDLSVAGRRRGMGEGTRSGLYWEVDRILGEFQPAWVVLENVPGLLSAACACPGDGTCVERGLAVRCGDDGNAHSVKGGACWGECISRHGGVMGAVLGSLAERGYGFAYRVLDARYFGVPQRRRRVVIVGRFGDTGAAPATVLLEPEGLPWDPCAGITPREVTAGTARAGVADGRAIGVLGNHAHTLTAEGHDASEDGTGRGTPVVTYAPPVASTLTAGVSNPGVSAPGRRQEDDTNVVAFHMTQDPISGHTSPALGATSGGMGIAYAAETAATLTAGGGQRGYRVDSETAAGGSLIAYASDVVGAIDTQQGGPDDNSAQAGHLVATFQKVVRSGARDVNGELPPDVWAERDVAATLSPFDLGSDSRAVDLVVQPVAFALRGREQGAVPEVHGDGSTVGALRASSGGSSRDAVLAPTLTASLGEGGWAGHNRKDEMVERTFEAGQTVRRLSPVECERLQGFPDGHTEFSRGKRQADSQRYKQLGNAVAVPVFEWVARRIVAVDSALRGEL